MKKINVNDPKNEILQKYLRSFSCLKTSLGVTLLESDFEKKLDEFNTTQSLPATINGLHQSTISFSNTWSRNSGKLISLFKKSKTREVRHFFQLHKDTIEKGTHNDVVALFLLPICFKVTKTFKEGNATISYSKEEISRSFILNVQDPENVDTEVKEYENWLQQRNLPILPYVVLCGEIGRIYQSYVIFNGEKYPHVDPVKAVESCYKCLKALDRWPTICDFVWGLLGKLVYGFDLFKSCAPVTKFLVELKRCK
ncbi:uncharacterized protein LOC127287081 [Leptopilina boulardi]|uniref:uncharacterized protein LOC127287081 n=1 Tax=Leptopilina boulardi TaxID=63433 RepID=UPI0021F5691D|nr:uncharacterized protein LOC127287081 [Leptopilina boulardi]